MQADFQFGAARKVDPETSLAAAKSVDATWLEAQVLKIISYHSTRGATAEEIAEELDMALNTVSPRTAPLVRKGLISDSGKRRRNRSGRTSIVWVKNA